ncbi:MAG: zinc ribbon domain-containing protein [Anaerolineae bacterium]|nr:zinc ribbon domain-containing protein [Anaerolineae bacterium]
MPIYLYRCEYCGELFEKMMRLTESDQSPECPYCKSQYTQKQITSFATQNSGGFFSSGGSCNSTGRFT